MRSDIMLFLACATALHHFPKPQWRNKCCPTLIHKWHLLIFLSVYKSCVMGGRSRRGFLFSSKPPSYMFECIQVVCHRWTLPQGLFVFLKNTFLFVWVYTSPVLRMDAPACVFCFLQTHTLVFLLFWPLTNVVPFSVDFGNVFRNIIDKSIKIHQTCSLGGLWAALWTRGGARSSCLDRKAWTPPFGSHVGVKLGTFFV